VSPIGLWYDAAPASEAELRAVMFSVWAVILSTAFLQTGNGLQTDLIGVRADLEAFPAWMIGLMMATYYLGYSLAPLGGRLVIGRVGHVATIAICVLTAAAVIATHPYFVVPWVWAGFRFISGFALSLTYIAYESWINDRVDNALRGRVFSLYVVTQMAAMTFAQLLFSLGDAQKVGPFLLASAMFVLAAAPPAFTGHGAPLAAPPAPFGLLRLFRLSPLGAAATTLGGLSWAIVFTFGPVYARHIGFDVKGVSLFMGLAMAAGCVAQFPLGWLSDVAGRRRVIALMFTGGFAMALLGLVFTSAAAAFVLSALIGAFVFPIYAVAVAQVNDRIASDVRVPVAAGLVLLFGIGSFFGPFLCGWAMTAMGPAGYFALLSIVMGAGALLAARYR
jgi:MFS family permease